VSKLVQNAIDVSSKQGHSLQVNLPPRTKKLTIERELEAWEDAAEDAIDALSPIQKSLEVTIKANRGIARAHKLKERLATAKFMNVPPIDESLHQHLQQSLFEWAVKVRTAWALLHGNELSYALRDALWAAEERASLRYLFRSKRKSTALVRQLFPVWGCTLLSMGNVFPPEEGIIDQIIVDEAGQCHPAYAISALIRCQTAMIIGDVHQLTPVVSLTHRDEQRFRKTAQIQIPDEKLEPYRVYDRSSSSVQSLAKQAVHKEFELLDHYRCQREIINISDALCDYGLNVHTPRRSLESVVPCLNHPVLLVETNGKQEPLGGSWFNQGELDLCFELLLTLTSKGVSPEQVAVITPYRGQLLQLRRGIIRMGLPMESSVEMEELQGGKLPQNQGLAVGTVHRFQGGERSIVIFSSTITRERSLPFINGEVNLLNVAVSRAKDHLIILGHPPTLSKGDNSRLLIENARPLVFQGE
jgi:hypothetical protein